MSTLCGAKSSRVAHRIISSIPSTRIPRRKQRDQSALEFEVAATVKQVPWQQCPGRGWDLPRILRGSGCCRAVLSDTHLPHAWTMETVALERPTGGSNYLCKWGGTTGRVALSQVQVSWGLDQKCVLKREEQRGKASNLVVYLYSDLQLWSQAVGADWKSYAWSTSGQNIFASCLRPREKVRRLDMLDPSISWGVSWGGLGMSILKEIMEPHLWICLEEQGIWAMMDTMDKIFSDLNSTSYIILYPDEYRSETEYNSGYSIIYIYYVFNLNTSSWKSYTDYNTPTPILMHPMTALTPLWLP